MPQAAAEIIPSALKKTQTDASKDIVSAVLSGQASTTQEDGTVVHDGITSIDFAQNVTVSEVLLAKTGIVNVDRLTKQLQNHQKTVCYMK